MDNDFYLSQPENYLKGFGWRWSEGENIDYKKPVGKGSYFRRVPGYSLFYFFFRKTFGFPQALTVIKIIQVFLFAFTAYMIVDLASLLTGNLMAVLLVGLVYGSFPLCNTFVYFTLTEGISGFLVVAYLYFLFKGFHTNGSRKFGFYLFASVFIGYGILTRPYIGIAGILLPVFIFMDWKKTNKNILELFKYEMVAGALPLLMICSWGIRNYYIAGEMQFLEQASHPNNLERLKPAFKAFWNLSASWGEDGSRLNSYFQPFSQGAMNGDTSVLLRKNILSAWPGNYVKELGTQRIENILKEYQQLIFRQRVYYKSNISMPDAFDPSDLTIAGEFSALKKEFIKKHPFIFYVKTPLIYLKEIVVHSNTSNVYMFDSRFYDNKFLYLIKVILKVIHIAAYGCILVNIFLIKRIEEKMVFVVVPVLFLIFFAFFFRAIEQRYMLVYLPVLVLGIVYPLTYLIGNLSCRNPFTSKIR